MSLTIPYEPRGWQKEVSKEMNRFTVLVLHRRAGKTVFDVIQSIGAVLSCTRNRPQAAYIAPNYGMAKKIAWDYYKEFLAPLVKKNLVTFNETALRIDFKTGAKIYLLGAEDPDTIRGMYMDHVVLDEYQMMPSDFFEKVIRPLLSDRQGKAIITGTPSGKNHFHEMYERAITGESPEWTGHLKKWDMTNVLPLSEIQSAQRDMSEEAFLQEYECSFEAAIRGAFFGKNIGKLRLSGRLIEKHYDPSYPVITGWDIGFDGTVIWYAQKIGDQIYIIDCDIFEDKDIPHVVNKVMNKPYTYQCQILPHDAVKRMIVDKRKTAKGQIESLGLKCKVAPKLSLDDGIHATRNLIDRAIFSTQCDRKVKVGRTKISPLDSLSLYRAEFDETRGVQNTTPVHDRNSHVADALRSLAVGIRNMQDVGRTNVAMNRPGRKVPQVINNTWDPFNLRTN